MNIPKKLFIFLLFNAMALGMNFDKDAPAEDMHDDMYQDALSESEQTDADHCAQIVEQLDLKDSQEPLSPEIMAYCCSHADGRKPLQESCLNAIKDKKEEFFSRAFITSVAASVAMGAQKYKHYGPVNSVVFDSTGKRLAAASRGYAHIFDTVTGQDVSFYHANPVNSVAFDPAGKRLATACGGKVQIFNIASEGKAGPVSIFTHTDRISSVVFDPSGDRLAMGTFNMVRIVDVSHPYGGDVICINMQPRLDGYDVLSVTFDSSGEYLAAAGDNGVRGSVCVFKNNSNELVAQFKHEGATRSVVFDPSGKYIAVASDKARIFNIASKKRVTEFDHGSFVRSVAFDPSGRLLATGGGNGKARIFDIANEERIGEFEHGAQVGSVIFDCTGERLATGSYDGTVRLFTLKYYKFAEDFLTLPESMEQLYLLQACDLAMQGEAYVHVTDEQWATFQTLPKQMQKALCKYVIMGEQYNRIKNKQC